MAGIKDVAREAGVSIGTVDRVLHDRGRVSEETKAKVRAVMEQLHYKPNTAAQGLAAAKKKLNLCFVVPEPTHNPFYYDIIEAAQRRAEKLKQYGVNTDICLLGGEPNSHTTQKIVQTMRQADGIAALGFLDGTLSAELKAAAKRGIPIVLYNTDRPDLERLAFVGCNYVDAGRLAAGLAARVAGPDASIAVFSQGQDENMEVASYTERVQGIQQEIDRHYPQMKIVAKRAITVNRAENERVVEDVLRSCPQVNVAYIANPVDYDICRILHEHDPEGKIHIITNDLVGNQIRMVRDETICATICQEPEKQGEQPLAILFQYLAYGVRPAQTVQYTNLSIHIAQSLPIDG